MATAAKSGLGTTLKKGDGASPEVFTTIAEVTDIDGPGMEQGTIDATNMDSANLVEKITNALIDYGEISFEVNWLPNTTGHKALITDMTNRTNRNFKLAFTDTAEWPFAALITGIKPKLNYKEKNGATVKLTLTSKPTFP